MKDWKEACTVASEVIDKERRLREKAGEERDQAEYDKEYFIGNIVYPARKRLGHKTRFLGEKMAIF